MVRISATTTPTPATKKLHVVGLPPTGRPLTRNGKTVVRIVGYDDGGGRFVVPKGSVRHLPKTATAFLVTGFDSGTLRPTGKTRTVTRRQIEAMEYC